MCSKLQEREINLLNSVKDNRPFTTHVGHCSRFWCCQDEQHKKRSKPLQKANAKHHNTIGMKRYPCRSNLSITYQERVARNPYIFISLQHHFKHVIYIDITMPPEALKLIEDQVEWITPAAVVSKIRAMYPQVSAAQVYNAW
jgi:hypothetical protein